MFSFNHAWNEFLFALVFTSSERNKALPLGLATWIGQDNIYSWGMLLAGAVLITIPVVLFYLLVQRKLVSGSPKAARKVNKSQSQHVDPEVVMKIKNVTVMAVEIPLSKNFGGSRYNVLTRCTIITRMETDTGLISEVYNGDNRDHMRELVEIIENELVPLVVGEDIFAVERIWQQALHAGGVEPRPQARDGSHRLHRHARSGTSSARRAGVNVCRLLGGYRHELPIISHRRLLSGGQDPARSRQGDGAPEAMRALPAARSRSAACRPRRMRNGSKPLGKAPATTS